MEGNRDNSTTKQEEVLGTVVVDITITNNKNDSNSSDDDSTDGNKPMALGLRILFEWEHRKIKLEHNHTITGWALSVMSTVRSDVVDYMNGGHSNPIKCVIRKLYEPSCPNKHREIKDKTIGDIIFNIFVRIQGLPTQDRTLK